MGYLSTLGAGAAKWASGINLTALFYKLLVYLGLVVLIATVSYREGKHDCEQTQLTSQISILEKQVITERETVIKELKIQQSDLVKRLEVISTNSKQAAQLGLELARIKGDLHEAINSRPANAACAPSASELLQYEELAKRTRIPTGRANGVQR